MSLTPKRREERAKARADGTYSGVDDDCCYKCCRDSIAVCGDKCKECKEDCKCKCHNKVTPQEGEVAPPPNQINMERGGRRTRRRKRKRRRKSTKKKRRRKRTKKKRRRRRRRSRK